MKVLMALDNSQGSQRALELAAQWLEGRDAAVTVLHVIAEHVLYGRAGAAPAEVYDLTQERERTDHLLNDALQYLREAHAGTTFSTLIRIGDPEALILEAAADEGADLIIMGSRGLGAAGRLLLGSVSTHVVTHAHTAVLVVHPQSGKSAR